MTMAVQIKGVDLSKWQEAGRVNFAELKELGYEFAILRAGYGKIESQKDIAFESHYAAAKAAGLHIGAYHYTYAVSVAEAKQEAACFLKWIEGKQLDYPVAFDIEDASLKKLTTAERTDVALAWMETVEAAGYYTMLYCSASWAKSYLDMDRLKHFDVWLACYTTEERRNELYTRDILGIWQHTSSLELPGVYGGKIDADIAYKDYAAIIKKAELNNLAATPAPVPEYAGKYTVTGNTVNLREGAGTSTKVAAVLTKSTEVICKGNAVDLDGTIWLEIDSGEQHGWMSAKYLERA